MLDHPQLHPDVHQTTHLPPTEKDGVQTASTKVKGKENRASMEESEDAIDGVI